MALTCPALPLAAQREMKTVNGSWEFRKPEEKQRTRINLPHTSNLDDCQKRDYYQGKVPLPANAAISVRNEAKAAEGKAFLSGIKMRKL